MTEQTPLDVFAAKHRKMYGNSFPLTRETEKAICVEMRTSLGSFDQWLPKSQIVFEILEDDWVLVAMPQWLARKIKSETLADNIFIL